MILVPSSEIWPSFTSFIACARLKHLDEQVFQFHQKGLAEIGQGVVIRMGFRRQKAEGHRIVGGPLDLAAGEHAGGIAINQQSQQYRRMVRRRSPSAVTAHQSAQIQLLDDFDDESSQVVVREPLVDRGREQVLLLAIDGNEPAHEIHLVAICREYVTILPETAGLPPHKSGSHQSRKVRQTPSDEIVEMPGRRRLSVRRLSEGRPQ